MLNNTWCDICQNQLKSACPVFQSVQQSYRELVPSSHVSWWSLTKYVVGSVLLPSGLPCIPVSKDPLFNLPNEGNSDASVSRKRNAFEYVAWLVVISTQGTSLSYSSIMTMGAYVLPKHQRTSTSLQKVASEQKSSKLLKFNVLSSSAGSPII